MARFHISQDETGYFQLSYENDQGELSLVSYQFDSPKQLIEDASEMAESGEFGDATVVIDPRRRVSPTAAPRAIAPTSHKPAPRKADA
jgi:hypothetical protein